MRENNELTGQIDQIVAELEKNTLLMDVMRVVIALNEIDCEKAIKLADDYFGVKTGGERDVGIKEKNSGDRKESG